MSATPDASVTVYVSIGNSDDKLSQAEWSQFVARVTAMARAYAKVIHGTWHSLPDAAYQNACWCLEFADDESMQDARDALTEIRVNYRQDSAAWAVATTEFL